MVKKGVNRMIDVKVELLYPKDDFYLQWPDIYWWQFKFNFRLIVENAMCELIKAGVSE